MPKPNLAWFWNPRLWTVGPAHYVNVPRGIRWWAFDIGPLRIQKKTIVKEAVVRDRDRYHDALRILRVSADFHQRNIIDKALGDE